MMIAVFAALLWVLNLVFDSPFGNLDGEALAKLLGKVSQRLREAPARFLFDHAEVLAIVVLAIGQLWYLRRASKHERLFLDESGIRYQSPLPEALRSLQPDWLLRWSQVRGARLVVPKALGYPDLAVLEFDAVPEKRRFFVRQWSAADSTVEPAAQDEGVSLRERFFSGSSSARDAERTMRAIEQSPLVRYARAVGIAVSADASRGTGSGFPLESNRHALVGALSVIVLLCYGLTDIAVYEESYAVDPPLVLFFLAAAIGALAGMLWFALAGVPRAETLGLSLFLGAAAGVASYPGLLRLNAATDTEGLRACEYRLAEYVVFMPADAALPVLKLSKYADYWGQFKLGTMHRFELRQGGLGFYQVNMEPVHARMREYFAGRN